MLPREGLQRRSRVWHLVTAVLAAAAVTLDLVLTLSGNGPSGTASPWPTRLLRFVGYFTIQSNVLVLVASARLAAGRDLDAPAWRVVRLAGLIGVTVAGVVYAIVLRPDSDAAGWSLVATVLLHDVVPVVAVLGWFLVGPRGLIDGRVVLGTLAWPALWFAWVLGVGAATGYYPYPFIDAGDLGYGQALLNALVVTALIVGLALGALALDRRLDPFGSARRRVRRPRAGLR